MSISDDARPEARSQPPAGPPGGGGYSGGGFDKSPPQDVAAEQSVLGGMLLSKDAIADVVEILKTHDFYRPVHATVFDTILDLYGRGEPADPVTVSAALADSGDLQRIGGVPYLHTLIESVPTAANASYYARIVSERAVLRRLVEAGTKIVQLGYGTGGNGGRDVDDIVDLAQQAVYDVTERRVSEDFAVLADMLQPTLDEIEAVGATGGMMTGVPTGFSDLDRLLNGLHAGQLIIVAGRPGLGKALALDTPIPTPTGWTTMGALRAGDLVLGDDGHPTTVIHAFDVMEDRLCFEVEFSDGSTVVADADHLWKTTTRAGRRQRAEIRKVPRWPDSARQTVTEIHATVMREPDDLVTFGEALSLVGERFRHVLHVVGAEVGITGRVTREYERRGKPWRRTIQAYSRQALITALAQRVGRNRNAEAMADHGGVRTTKEIAETLRHPADGRANHAVENAAALQLPEATDLPVPPYTLGVWLGDGHSKAAARFTTADPEIAGYLQQEGRLVEFEGRMVYAIKVPPLAPLTNRVCLVCGAVFTPKSASVMTCGQSCGGQSRGAVAPEGFLRAAEVFDDKHIPMAYLRASVEQRRAVLAGLMDTDGTVTPSGTLQFAVASERLAENTRELIVSLGYRCSMTRKRVLGRTEASSIVYTLNFSTSDPIFRLERKHSAHQQRCRTVGRARTGSRYVTDVQRADSVPVRCITVSNESHMYLAGHSMIPTHNSTVSMDFARNAAIRANCASAIFSLEMSKIEIVMRLLSAEARVPLHVLRSGQLSDDDWSKLARRMGEISEAPIFVDDTPSMNLMEIRAKARRLKQRHNLKLIVVDYLQLMTSPKRTESRQQEVADLSRGLKLLAKEVECPVIAVSQLNRGPEQRTDKRPMLSDLRESGSIEQDADVVILLHRDDYYDKESPRAGEADFIIAKHRNGPTDTVTVAAQLHLSRFVDMAIG